MQLGQMGARDDDDDDDDDGGGGGDGGVRGYPGSN